MSCFLWYRIKDLFTHTGDHWDHLAPSKNEAIEFAHKNLNKDPKKMIDKNTCSQEFVLAHYGEIINAQYRKGRITEDNKHVPDMLRHHQTKKDIVVYRGISRKAYAMMKIAAADYPDTDLLEKGFLATSLVKGHESNSEIRLRIYVPAGTHAVYQGNINDELQYYEVDIQYGAHLKIISIDRQYINCILLYTE